MLSRLMETKTSLVLQVPTKHKHEKKQHEYKPYILVINPILKN